MARKYLFHYLSMECTIVVLTKPYFQPDFPNKTTLVAKKQIKYQPYYLINVIVYFVL
jgi:hypothetical protein